MGIPVEDTEALVASLDKDGDGLLRFDDFVKLMEGENEQDRLNCLEEAIEMYDMDDFVLLNSKSCWCRTLHQWVGKFKAALVRSNRKTNRGTNLIPVSRKDLKNIAFKQKPLFCTTIGKLIQAASHWVYFSSGCWHLPYFWVIGIASGLFELEVHTWKDKKRGQDVEVSLDDLLSLTSNG
ncbi:putative calcium-binding protein CML31 [Trifolium pratense]|uniref:Putative calcium-binding protein CML31 n=1 Tax=Trifolium pratense TaxID=57577 RepID=A0A2K3PHL0_TRIPR|nr:putative calcium-binding protein CML31 [Trifolium pratense]